jgi:hypothetical protein
LESGWASTSVKVGCVAHPPPVPEPLLLELLELPLLALPLLELALLALPPLPLLLFELPLLVLLVDPEEPPVPVEAVPVVEPVVVELPPVPGPTFALVDPHAADVAASERATRAKAWRMDAPKESRQELNTLRRARPRAPPLQHRTNWTRPARCPRSASATSATTS